MSDTPRTVEERITAYLSMGGLFNPELANHDAVRDLLIDARSELTEARKDAERYRWARDDASDVARDSAFGVPCGLTADEPQYKATRAAIVDAAIDAAMKGER